MTTPNTPPRWRLSRRGLFIGTGVGVALLVGWRLGVPALRQTLASATDGTEKAFSRGAPSAEPTAWMRISPDNQVTLFVQKIEMGQGIHTALAQIAAEELDIDWAQITVVAADTGSAVDDPNGTGNSESVVSHYLPLRQAGATLRAMLVSVAAARWGVDANQLSVRAGVITHEASSLTYGDIVAAQSGEWQIPDSVPALKDRADWGIIGKPATRLDLPAKVTGAAQYGHDIRVPGMLWGVIARPPQIGAVLTSADERQARQVDGVVAIINDPPFVGVVGTSKSTAMAGLSAMDIKWSTPDPVEQATIDQLTTVVPGSGVDIQLEGNPDSAPTNAIALQREFRTPMAAHAHLEPQAAVVHVQADRVEAWVSTQVPVGLAQAIAEAVDRPIEQVTVHPVYLGGGFGRRLDPTLGIEAARLSLACGQAVAVQWSRADEFQHGFVRPPTHHQMQGSVSTDGIIQTLAHYQASGDVLLTIFPPIVGSMLGWDIGAMRGGMLYYTAAQGKRVQAQRVALPVATSFWRGLGLLANGFAIESFIDDLAHAANIDPLEFRLRNLPDTPFGIRMKGVLTAAATAAQWGTPRDDGRALGIACSADAGTCVAQVAEVSIVDSEIRVHHVYAAIDPGLVINPTGVQTQTEGGITMGLGSTLIEELTVAGGRFTASNFDRYPLLRNSQAPDITVVINSTGDEPGGMGEPPIGPIAGAVGNAVFALTGQRLTSLPLRLPA